MFGYIRPYVPELRLREYEQYRAVYCTLCHTLKETYGHAARFTLNFDFVFLIMLYWQNDYDFSCNRRGCMRRPISKCNIIKEKPDIFQLSGGLGVILSYWKLKDEIKDSSFFKSIKYRLSLMAIRGGYKKAEKMYEKFSENVNSRLLELEKCEEDRIATIDQAADKFAGILSDISSIAGGGNERIYSELLYHTGRWIYITDAYNDIYEDIDTGNYNPIVEKYGIKAKSDVDDYIKGEIDLTLNQSLGRVQAAFELLDETIFSDIIRNIIYIGMPLVMKLAREGKFNNTSENINFLE